MEGRGGEDGWSLELIQSLIVQMLVTMTHGYRMSSDHQRMTIKQIKAGGYHPKRGVSDFL